MTFRSRLLAVATLAFALPAAAQTPHLTTDLQKLSYALGQRFAMTMMQQGLTELDPNAVALGVADRLNGIAPRVTQQEVAAAQEAVLAMINKNKQEASRKTLKDGLDFLAANKEREGVIELPSGVQYRIIEQGDGKQPTPTDQVVVHYRGTLLTGQEFDSSYKRGEPLTFGLDRVIPGWTQVVSSIKVGTKVETWIPPKQGYGERGSPPTIPGNSTLYFQIELLEVK